MTETESFEVDETVVGYGGEDDENGNEPRTFERGYKA